MLAIALVLVSLGTPARSGGIQLRETPASVTTFTTRDLGALPNARRDLADIASLIPKLNHEFTLRGMSEVDPSGVQKAFVSLRGDPAATAGLVHAISLAEVNAASPVRFHVPARGMPAGTYQDTDYGLRGFDLSVPAIGGPIVVGRYWFPDSTALTVHPPVRIGMPLPAGSDRPWQYRDGSWRIDTPLGVVPMFTTPSQISVERRGIDLNNVRYRIRNNTDEPFSGSISPGQVLVPDNSEDQRMVTISRERFALPPNGLLDLDVRAACLEIGKHEPRPKTLYDTVPNRDPVLSNLLNITANSPLLGPWNQAMFWMHTDGASMEQINERLGFGVAPIQYQQAAAQIAMHGGLDPMDGRYSQVLDSLAVPTSLMMGMHNFRGTTSLLAPNLGSGLGFDAIRRGWGEVPNLVKSIELNDAQQESLAKTCSTFLYSGDPNLSLTTLRLIHDLGARYRSFAARQDVQGMLEYARSSPDTGMRSAAGAPGPLPQGASLFDLATHLSAAEDAVRGAVSQTSSTPPDAVAEPTGFQISFSNVPEMLDAGKSLALSTQSHSGEVLAVSYSYQSTPLGTPKQIAQPSGGTFNWTPDVKGPAVLQLRAQAVSRDGQIAYSTTPVYVAPVAMNLRADLADALRRARAAHTKRDRALGEAQRKRQEYDRIVGPLRKHWNGLQALQSADRDLLDGLEGQFKAAIDALLARNKDLGGGAAPKPGDVDKAAEDAQNAADDCKKEMAELEQQKADAEKQQADAEKAANDALKAVSDIYLAAGFTGGTGHHASGSGWFGFVGEGPGLSAGDQRSVSNHTRDLHAANKALAKAKQRAKDLDAKIKAKHKECEDLEKRNAEAQKAKANKDEVAATNAQMGQAWDSIAQKLKDLQDALAGVEGGAGLAGEASALAGGMPTNQAGWDAFWQRLRNLIQRKKALEADLERKIKAGQDAAKTARDAAEKAEQEARDAARVEAQAAAEAAATQEGIGKAPPPADGGGGGEPPKGQSKNPCMEKFATWLKKYQDKMDQSQLDRLKNMLGGAIEAAQVPGQAIGDAIAGGAQAMVKGAGGAAVGLNALASGVLSLGAGLFYAYAQSEIAKALGPLGSKIRLQRVAALVMGSKDPCGEVGAGGATGTGLESFFYFRVGDKLLVFRGGADGVECVGVGDSLG